MAKWDAAAIDLDRFERACARLGEVVVDPVIWPEVMSDICQGIPDTVSRGGDYTRYINRNVSVRRAEHF